MNDKELLKEKLNIASDQELATFLGIGKTAVSSWKGQGTPKYISAFLPFISKDSREDCTLVDIYNMVEAGNGAEPEWHEPIDTRIIPTSLLKTGVRPVLVRGRSMEPTFKNGAVIGIDESDKQVIGGEAYAVLLPYEGAVVKRLYPVPDGVVIRSDNKEFPEVSLKREDIPDYFILGRVCWVVQEV